MSEQTKKWDDWIYTFSCDLILAGYPYFLQDWGSANANPARCFEFISYYIETETGDPIADSELADLVLTSCSLYLNIAPIPERLETALRECINQCQERWGMRSRLHAHYSIVVRGDTPEFRKTEPFSYWLLDRGLLDDAPKQQPSLPDWYTQTDIRSE